MAKILHCKKCNVYTLKKKCPKCGSEINKAEPPRFSIRDKYGEERRVYKRKKRNKKQHGIIH